MTAKCEIYFIQDDAKQIKIGVCLRGTAKERLIDLQIGNARPLVLLATVPGNYELEASLHRQFAHLNVRGEWFRAEGSLLDFIANLRACLEVDRSATHDVPEHEIPNTPWWNAKDAGRYCRRGHRFLIREVNAGRLQAARVGGRRELLFRREWLDQWLESHTTPLKLVHRRTK